MLHEHHAGHVPERFELLSRNGVAAGAEALEEALEAVAHTALRSARRRAPVLTGRLRDSLVLEKDSKGWLIRAPVPYALVLEFGGISRPAQPFLRPAIRYSQRNLAREVKKRMPRR
jgi:HK97 gp10 family phage protein